MRIILLAGMALAVTACGGGNKANNSATANNMMTTNTMTTSDPMMTNGAAPMGTTGDMNSMGNMGGNMTMDANTQKAMEKDMKTNDPDTNLANGM
jgi:hypothetical protein